jgi:hypothetical protein
MPSYDWKQKNDVQTQHHLVHVQVCLFEGCHQLIDSPSRGISASGIIMATAAYLQRVPSDHGVLSAVLQFFCKTRVTFLPKG